MKGFQSYLNECKELGKRLLGGLRKGLRMEHSMAAFPFGKQMNIILGREISVISLGARMDVKLENEDTAESSLHTLNEGVYKTHNNWNSEEWKFLIREESSQLPMKHLQEL